MVFAQTDGIVSVLLHHTHTRGPSVTRMRNFLCLTRSSGQLSEPLHFSAAKPQVLMPQQITMSNVT